MKNLLILFFLILISCKSEVNLYQTIKKNVQLKTGKWVFFNEKNLCEVAYENSKISSVKNLQKNALANRN